MTVKRLEVTEALGNLLTAAVGFPFGIAVAPDASLPFGVIYPIDGSTFPDNFAATYGQAQLAYQVDSVGANYSQAEWLADKVRAVVLDIHEHTLSITGAAEGGRFPDTGPTVPVQGGESVWTVSERFTILVTAQ